GTEQLFGRTPTDPENIDPEEEGLDMIRDIPREDESALQPANARQRHGFQARMTSSLETAILYFLSCCSARRARGDDKEHMTMLIHTSAFVSAHEQIASLIEHWVTDNRTAIIDRTSNIAQKLKFIWEAESKRLPEAITDAPAISTQDVFLHLEDVLDYL